DVRGHQLPGRRHLHPARSAGARRRSAGMTVELSPRLGSAAAGAETPLARAASEFAESPAAVIALGLGALRTVVAVAAPLIAPQNPYDLAQLSIMDNKLAPWSRGIAGQLYALGTDDQGRDMLSAMLYGLRLSLFVAITATAIAFVLGTAVGIVAAYLGGRLDTALMRLVDIPPSFPSVLIALILVAILGKGVDKVVIALIPFQCAYSPRPLPHSALLQLP